MTTSGCTASADAAHFTWCREDPRVSNPLCCTSARYCALLVDAHIIHAHDLREDRGLVRTAGPMTTHGDVHDDEERVVVHPPTGKVPRRDRLVQRAVHVPANRLRLPLDGIHVKTLGERAGGQLIRGPHALGTRVAGTVHGAVHQGGFPADVLHDVDLAALGPADFVAVVAQHPEGGPQSLPARDLNPCLHAGVSPRSQPLGLQPGRRVLAIPRPLLPGHDNEVAVFDTRVFGAVGVELQLGVAPAVAPGLPHPFRRVEGRPVEFVAPHESPARLRRFSTWEDGANADREYHPKRNVRSHTLGRLTRVDSQCRARYWRSSATRGRRAGPSCSASRTPTSSAPPRSIPASSWTGSPGWGSTGTKKSCSRAPEWSATGKWRTGCSKAGRRTRKRAPSGSGCPRARSRSTTRCMGTSRSRARTSAIGSSCAPTARPPTTSRSWWTTLTCASPTSCAATITSPTRPSRSPSTGRWALPSPCSPTCP